MFQFQVYHFLKSHNNLIPDIYDNKHVLVFTLSSTGLSFS